MNNTPEKTVREIVKQVCIESSRARFITPIVHRSSKQIDSLFSQRLQRIESEIEKLPDLGILHDPETPEPPIKILSKADVLKIIAEEKEKV